MASPKYIVRCIARLIALKTPSHPVGDAEIVAMQEAWLEEFDEVTDEQLGAALREHTRTCKFWPQPADIFGFIARTEPDSLTAEQLWDRILERVRVPGRNYATDGSRQIAFGDILDERQQAALRSIGGSRAIGAADNDFILRNLRERWLRAMAGGTVIQLRRAT